ncbi:hypothetical protein [Solibacillus sp. CAU 1738]|uniref:hypothetical protein n=1 Tax=Solibacillus sp. CAU 1738 TaxID=3140363 RepID=UPI003260ECDE
MKKSVLIIIGGIVSALLIGCNTTNERQAQQLIENYYNAMKERQYEIAFDQLYIFDDHYTDGPSFLSEQEAKNLFNKKINILEEQDYYIKDFEIVNVEYEDGHSFWHHINIVVEQKGQRYEWEEVAQMYEGKLIVDGKNDPYVQYRNGQMNVNFEFES